MDVPAIIDERTFNAAQALLQSRQPRRTAPRLVNTPTLLAGIARCGYCGAALIQNTGKGGQYRYYACGSRLKKGATACRGQRMPMSKLDDIVIGEVTRRILHPDRLTVLLEGYLQTAQERDERHRDQLRDLRHALGETEAGLARLMDLVEKGLMDISDPALRERLVALRFRRDELADEISALAQRLANADPVITREKVKRLATMICKQLHHGAGDLRQAYTRLVLNEVIVSGRHITISGSKSVLARSAANDPADTSPAVLSFVQVWRARQGSNLRPQA